MTKKFTESTHLDQAKIISTTFQFPKSIKVNILKIIQIKKQKKKFKN